MFSLLGTKLLAAKHSAVAAVKKFVKGKEEGASMVEYAILLGLVTALVIAAVVTLGGKVQAAFNAVNSAWTS
jgi:pilus assembly protein Flp/PilA